MINCPICKRPMEVTANKTNLTYYQFLCRSCLCYWDMKKIEMSDDDIRELAQE